MKIINNVKYVLLRIFNSYVVDLHQPAILGFYLIFAFFTLWLVLKCIQLKVNIITIICIMLLYYKIFKLFKGNLQNLSIIKKFFIMLYILIIIIIILVKIGFIIITITYSYDDINQSNIFLLSLANHAFNYSNYSPAKAGKSESGKSLYHKNICLNTRSNSNLVDANHHMHSKVDSISLSEIYSEHGSYKNYLKNTKINVDEEYIQKNYQEYIENTKFINLINHLVGLKDIDPNLKKDLVIKIYNQINNYNILIEKFIIFNSFLGKKLSQKFLLEILNNREELIKLINELSDKKIDLNDLLNNFNTDLKNQILLKNSVNFEENKTILINDKFFIDLWNEIINIINNDTKFIESDKYNNDRIEYNSIMENNLINLKCEILNLYSLYNYCQDNKINYSEVWSYELLKDLKKYSTLELYKNYQQSSLAADQLKQAAGWINSITDGTKKISVDNVFTDYKEIIKNYIYNFENLIINYYKNNLDINNNLEDIKKSLEYKNIINNKTYKDYKFLLKRLTNLYSKIGIFNDLSKNPFKKLDTLNDFFSQNLDHDEIIHLTHYISEFSNLNNQLKPKIETLNNNSDIFINARKIISDDKLSLKNKQLALETFILNYEKEFSLNLIKNMGTTLKDFKLISKIYKHSTPRFLKRLESFISNNKLSEFKSYFENKDNISQYGNHLALALFLIIKDQELVNIIFCKIIRIIGTSGGIKQTEFIDILSKELIVILKYYSKKERLSQLIEIEKIVVLDILSRLDSLTIESKFQFGLLIFEFILSEFDFIFEKINIYENKENNIYILVKEEFLAVLAGSIFNPIRLPMVCEPKKWEFKETLSGGIIYTNIGGYYLEEYSDLSSNNSIIKQSNSNKFQSEVSSIQVNTVNFLNQQSFEINSNLLDILVEDWYNKENSLLFKGYNNMHPKTNELEKLPLNMKKEIMSHNSKYWNFSNILNISLLFKGESIYFPNFLDFRGRIYPLPNYLSYQSNDLARSLLLFKKVIKEESNNPDYVYILNEILKNGIYSKGSTKSNKLDNLDYIKMYLANVYGKNKLSRKGKINWFNQNIENMIKSHEESKIKFYNDYVNFSKEPFQFLSLFLSYYNFLTNNEEIKNPILFDATCSGIQHLSALTKDIKIANLVNLTSNDTPSDFYQFSINSIKKAILSNELDNELKDKLLLLNINRKWLKQSIMTVPYNVSTLGICDKLSENFKKIFITYKDLDNLKKGKIKLDILIKQYDDLIKEGYNKKEKEKEKGTYILVPKENILLNINNNCYFSGKELMKFAGLVRFTVLNIIPPFTELKDYFDKIIDILHNLNIPFFWVTPSEMNISMSTILFKSKKVRTNLFKKAKPISLLIPTDQINTKKIKLGLMPNFIHSLDASNIHILIKNVLNLQLSNLNLYTIHDCFASDYKNIALIELLVKHSFIQLYFKKDYLSVVHNSFVNQIASFTKIYLEIDTGKQYILLDYNKIYLPELPKFEWKIDENRLKKEILFNDYFIS